MRLQVRLTFSQTLGQADHWFLFFPIACPMCDDKSSSSNVVPWCSNTPDAWWKDMCKLVWTENSRDSISLHLVQAYVIRWHWYKTANGPCRAVELICVTCLALARLVTPRGTSGECWAQCGWASSSPPTNYVTNPKFDRLTFLHMAGWLANCSWLTGYVTKCQPDPPPGRDILWPSVLPLWSGWPVVRYTSPGGQLVTKCDNTSPVGQVDLWSDVCPRERHLVAKCDTTLPVGQVDVWSDVPPIGRGILWPSAVLLHVRLTCLLEGKSGASSHGNSSSTSRY